MAKKNLKVKVDTINGLYKPEGTIKQLDSVFFNIEVTEEGEKKDLTGQTIKLFARKSDGKMVEQSSGISITNAEQGELTIDLLNAAVQAPGYVYFELEISDSNGIISTADFVYKVMPKVGSDEAIESTNEVSTLKEIEVYVAQAKQEIKEFKKLKDEMLETNEAINNQEVLREDAERKRIEAEIIREEKINKVIVEISKKANDNEVRKKDILIETKDIKDFTINPINTNFFDIEVDYKNILNINAQEIGALDTSNGNLSPISSFSRILFIPVVENTNYVFSINNLVSTNLSMVCYYRADKTFISGVTNVNKFTTPKDTAFISIVVYGTFNPKAQLEKGTDCTPFRPYKNITKNDGIKEEHLVKAMRKITPLEVQVNELFTFTSLDLVIEKGYYDTNKFFPNLAYDSVKIECKPGEKYKVTCFMLGIAKMPVARFYNSSFEEIAKTEIITNDETLKDYEIVVPSVENITYMTITCSNTSDVALEVEKYTSKLEKATKKPTCGLKYIAIGDSITAQSDRWRDQFIKVTGAKEIMCTAVPGAHLADYNDTILNGTNFEGHGNTVCNQIQKIINNPPEETPDFIIISAITNDTLGVEQLDKDINVFIDNDGFTYKDIETIDRTIIEGAMRWQVEKLYKLFPNVVIFFASPIQAFEGIRATWNILKKEDKIIRIARKMSVQVIKASSESGIYGRYEKRNENGKYLIDGLHPNKAGGIKLGNYYANQVLNYYNYL